MKMNGPACACRRPSRLYGHSGRHNARKPACRGKRKALLTFVGRTGNDFLEVLKAHGLAPAKPAQCHRPIQTRCPCPRIAGFAGNATASSACYRPVWRKSWPPIRTNCSPLAFPINRFCIEGEILRPAATSKAKSCRLFFFCRPFAAKSADPAFSELPCASISCQMQNGIRPACQQGCARPGKNPVSCKKPGRMRQLFINNYTSTCSRPPGIGLVGLELDIAVRGQFQLDDKSR